MHIDEPRILTVVLVVGVNGAGKTTSIGKMAYWYKQRTGAKSSWAQPIPSVLLLIDQLKVWGQRAGVEVIAHDPGADPGAVIFDAIRASQEKAAAPTC